MIWLTNLNISKIVVEFKFYLPVFASNAPNQHLKIRNIKLLKMLTGSNERNIWSSKGHLPPMISGSLVCFRI